MAKSNEDESGRADNDRKLNVGILSFYYPHLGGSGIITSRLASYLSRQGHNVYMIGYPEDVNPSHMRDAGVKLCRTSDVSYPCLKSEPYTMTLASEVVNVHKNVGLDVLHANYAVPHAISAYLAREKIEMDGGVLPYVVTGHGSDIHTNGRKNSVNPMLSLGLDGADAVTFVSRDLQDIAKNQLGYTGESAVVPNFVDTSVFYPNKSPLRTQLGIPADDFVVSHVSNFAPVKQVHTFANLASVLKERGRLDGVHFVMAGDGAQRAGLESYLVQKGVRGNFRFLGELPSDEIPDVYNASDCVVLPSKHEGNPLTLLEGMACGVPVVGSRVGGIEETVEAGGGVLFEDGNASELADILINLRGDPELARNVGQKGLERVKSEYSPEEVLKQYLGLFEEVIRKRNK